ncbi:hypothetical protein DES49_2041 [Halospina denitrificans]|uniref:Lipoprotein n=1 Tax=Halospina denitrificans TaxID=332522 RepID=A0A4R7JQR9_9GAMM|nr:hypothetical protein [Halospina denitrificans]TDT40275.1 hypothetical protein DES49_2041 [Halospina denitrificans]
MNDSIRTLRLRTVSMLCMMVLLLSGCAGALVLHNSENQLQAGEFVLGGRGYLSEPRSEPLVYFRYTKAEVEAEWGEPDAIFHEAGKEQWLYKRGLAWYTLMPVFAVPIPLGVPVGSMNATLAFSGNRVVSATERVGDMSGGLCGFFPMAHPARTEFGCIGF